MKKIAFAWITEVIDFDNREEAIAFVRDNQGKRWNFKDYKEEGYKTDSNDLYGRFILHTSTKNGTFAFKDKEVKEFWTVQVNKPYGNYNSGW